MNFKTNLSEILTTEFITHYPEISETRAKKYMAGYLLATLYNLREYIRYLDCQEGIYQIQQQAIACATDRITYKNKLVRISKLCEKYESLKLYLVVKTGHTGYNTECLLNPNYMEKIMAELQYIMQSRVTERQRQFFREHPAELCYTACDLTSLQSFQFRCQEIMSRTASDQEYYHATYRNMLLALDLETLVEPDPDTGGWRIPEYYECKDTGRCYSKFLGLQTLPKVVRHAALGHCWLYDFKAHSFAVLASECMRIAQTQGITVSFPEIQNYVKHRAPIRKKIASDTGIPEYKIKQIFTSLGFGAEVQDNPFKSIRKCLTAEQYKQLTVNQTFVWITKELQSCKDILLAYYTGTEFMLCGREYQNTYQDAQGKTHHRKPSQRLAWIYQCLESEITTRFIYAVTQAHELWPLLTVHDGIYYAKPIPCETLRSIRWQLQQTWSLVDIETTEIWPITTNAHYEARIADPELQNHKDRIAQEESQAKQILGQEETAISAKHMLQAYWDHQREYYEKLQTS